MSIRLMLIALALGGMIQLTRAQDALRPQGGAAPARVGEDRIPPVVHAYYATLVEQDARALEASGVLSRARTPMVGGLQWPLRSTPAYGHNDFHGISNFVDLNPTLGALLDYECGTRTYDLGSGYNHGGTDYFLWPFAWQMMDAGVIEIVAAAPGTIISKIDGNNDRSCPDNYSANWNAVYVQHSDGTVMWYGHMKTGSLTAKTVGQTVAAGEYLGLVGSSGFSTGPHLHMELRSSNAGGSTVLEPFAGSCRAGVSLWANQRNYREPRINRIATHNAAPSFTVNCPNPGQENARFDNQFARGETAFFAIYLHDQIDASPVTITILTASGAVYDNFTTNLTGEYNASYWYWTRVLPANAEFGTWTFRATYAGETIEHAFEVGDQLFSNGFE